VENDMNNMFPSTADLGEAPELGGGNGFGLGPRRSPIATTTLDIADTMMRERVELFADEVFGVDFGFKKKNGDYVLADNGEKIKIKPKVWGYRDRTPYVPDVDPAYIFPTEALKILLMGIKYKDTILITGETGTGKTSIMEQIAARLNYNLVKLSFDGGVQREDLIGEYVVRDRQMVFQEGVLLFAMRMPGTIILLDEWDALSPECAFVLQRPLQREDRKIMVMPLAGKIIGMHEDNVIVATANTKGQGDDSGNYAGTKVQNFAQVNRFSMTLPLGYMKPEDEEKMLKLKVPGTTDKEAAQFVKTVNEMRKSFENGDISVPVSARDLINWAEKYARLGDPKVAAHVAFVDRMSREDAHAIDGLLQRRFIKTVPV
jgi:cobaltochelatase CobS